jgi:hypothetical protein
MAIENEEGGIDLVPADIDRPGVTTEAIARLEQGHLAVALQAVSRGDARDPSADHRYTLHASIRRARSCW